MYILANTEMSIFFYFSAALISVVAIIFAINLFKRKG